MQRHAHLSTRGEDVDGAVVVEIDERAVDGGRLGQLLDLIAQRRDLIAGLLDGDRQLLIVRPGLGHLTTSFEEMLFEHLNAPRRLLDVVEDLFARRSHDDLVVVIGTVWIGVALRTVHNATIGESDAPAKSRNPEPAR